MSLGEEPLELEPRPLLMSPSSGHRALRGSVVLGVCADPETYNQPTELQSIVTAKIRLVAMVSLLRKGSTRKQ